MQEEVLSRRKLFFLNDQVFFRCQEATISEAMNTPGYPLREFDGGFSLYSIMLVADDGFSDFASLIMYYTTRSLSHESDILRAAQGMLHRYSSLNKKDLIEGLPGPLDQSLLFSKYDPLVRSVNSLSLRRDGFPSYSWTGWRSVAHWDVALNSAAIIPDSSSNNSQLTNTSAPEDVLSTWIRWHLICKDDVFLVDSDGNRQPSTSSSINEFLPHCRPEFRNYSIPEDQDDHNACIRVPYTVLLFWTVCINLTIVKPSKVTTGADALGYHVLSYSGEVCGEVILDTCHFDGMREGMFALITGNPNGRFWALLLKRHQGGHMERWGLANLASKCLDGHSQHAPLWKKIILA